MVKTVLQRLVDRFLGWKIPALVVFSKVYDKYGRSVAELYQDGVSISKLMIDSGHAVPYTG